MKLAITGKGGVGKTTVSALLAHELRRRGGEVIAIDADPDSNLAATMGYTDPIEPLVELKALIEERTGVKPGTVGGMFRLNPFVDDIPDKYAVDIGGVSVLVAGAVKKGGSGCYCPENAMLRALVSGVLTDPRTSLVLDMEAGVEHLSRGTVRAVDHLVIVVDPGRRAIETAQRIRRMATEIGLERVSVIGNKIRTEKDEQFVRDELEGMQIAGFLPFDDRVRDAEIARQPAGGASPALADPLRRIVDFLEQSRAHATSTGGTP